MKLIVIIKTPSGAQALIQTAQTAVSFFIGGRIEAAPVGQVGQGWILSYGPNDPPTIAGQAIIDEAQKVK